MRFTLEQVKSKIEEYGDTLNSTEYRNYRQKLQIKCHKCNDDYEQSYQMILKGYWCTKTCRSDNYANRDNSNNGIQKYTYDEVENIINKTNNTLCSTEYINGKSKLDIRCNECRQIYKMTFYNFNILKQGCQHCYIETRKLNNDTFKDCVEKRGDILLGTYVDSRTKITIQCGKCNNVFYILSNRYRQGSSCLPCGITKRRLEYDEVKSRIEYYGDKLLSTEYISQNSPLDIQCGKCSKIFQKSMYSNYQPFCRFCNSTMPEKIMMTYLNNNEIEFTDQKSYSDCLSKHGKKFRFDFYLPDGNIIVETDGLQHFKPVKFSSKDYNIEEWFKVIQARDCIKTKYCIDNNIKIIRVSYKELQNKETFKELMDSMLIKIKTDKYIFSNDELYKYIKI